MSAFAWITDATARGRLASVVMAWHEGVSGLREKRMHAMGEWKHGDAMTGFSDPPKLNNPKTKIGRSELLARKH